MRRPLILLALGLSCLFGCASEKDAHVEKPLPPPPVHHSSLDAVLAYTTELALTQTQIDQLTQLEARRDQQDQASRAQAKAQADAQKQAAPADGTGPASTGQMAGAAMGSQRAGGRSGGGRLGAGGRNPAPHAQASKDPKLNQQYDDHDTQAFTAGLEALDEKQRPRAIELASKYREELFDYRAALEKQRE